MQLSKVFIAVVSALCTANAVATEINNNQIKTIDNQWSDTFTWVGYTTDGTLNIIHGGDVQTNQMHIGRNDGVGIVNVIDGGKLTVVYGGYANSFDIGGSRDGVTSDSHGGTGTLNISGAGSLVTVSQDVAQLNVGAGSGSGVLNITDGGKLRHEGASSSGIWIGGDNRTKENGETHGIVHVDGQGSELWSADRIMVGTYGSGVLTTSNGGLTRSEASISVGNEIETRAYDNLLQVDGAGSRVSAGTKLIVGLEGRGTAVASDQGVLQAREIYIANLDGASGELAIGARKGEAAAAAGAIDTGKIIFGAGQGALTLNHTGSDVVLAADIQGKGAVSALAGVSELSGDNTAYEGQFSIDKPATLVVSEQKNLGNNTVSMSGGTLSIATAHDWRLVNTLAGQGVLAVNTGGSQFDIDSAALTDGFSGTLSLEETHFLLDGTNTAALKNIRALLGEGSITTVGEGRQVTGGLAFNGGTLVFGEVFPGETTSSRFVDTTGELDLTGTGQVQITDGGDVVNGPRAPDTSLALTEQDEHGVLVQLAGSQGTVTGSGGNLTLTDQTGNRISAGVISHITQNDEVVANGSYDYRLTGGDKGDGLYVNYGLTEVELLAKGDNALSLDAAGRTGSAADLSARITGSGDLHIATDTPLSLSNSENNYTGVTLVQAGTLKMNNNQVLGQTPLLSLAPDTQLDMNGYAQTLQNIVTRTGSVLGINRGSLTVNNGVIDGTITGDGHLTVTGGQLTVSSDNPEMRAATTIATDGSVQMLAGQALGSGPVNNRGMLRLGADGGTTRATAPAAYQTGSLTNSGTVVIGHQDATGAPVAGTTLTVNGNYTGEGGHLVFNTVLGNDSAVTDKLVVTGDTSGSTGVRVNNAGGRGDQTLNGIELVNVAGRSEGTFTQEGRIVAGAYDYALVRGQQERAGNWYLTSQVTTPPVDPTDPVDPVDPVLPPSDSEHVNRPEGGSYIANLAAANTLFNTRLHDRLGETQYTDALTGEQKVTSLWLRQVGSHNRWHDSSGQLKTQSNSYVAQLGGDVAQWSTDGRNRGHLGLMAGYANSHSNTHSSVTGYGSRGSIEGYSVGAYGSWFASEADQSGLYVDSWLQYSWFNNHVNGEQLASESYHSRGFTASLESGYTLKAGEFASSRGTEQEWFIQPQAQITWMGVRANRHHEENGTGVSSRGDGNLQTRLGIRTYLKGHSAADAGKSRSFEPFIEANWLHNTRGYSVTMDDVRISQAGARNLGEVKVGVEGQVTRRLNLWGNVGTQVGDEGYSDSSAMVGVKWNF